VSKFLFAAVAASLTFAAPAALAAENSFTYEGVTYTYSTTVKDGVQVIEGSGNSGAKFRMTVKNGWVDGYFDRARVSFRAPKLKTATEVAQR